MVVRWQREWSVNESINIIMKHLLEEIEDNEKSFSDMHSPIIITDKRVTTEYDSENVSKELFVRTLATTQEN